MKSHIIVLCLLLQSFSVAKANEINSILAEKGKIQSRALLKQSYVRVDLINSEVKWHVLAEKQKVEAEAKIYFYVKKKGRPILLLNPLTEAEEIGGTNIKLIKVDHLRGNYFVLDKVFTAGALHSVKLKYSFTHDFENNKTFLPVNYSKHEYIEMGIPANTVDDRFKVKLNIKLDDKYLYKVIANGQVQKISDKNYIVNFPSYTSISHFIDIVPKSKVVKLTKNKFVRSIDGRKLELIVYSTKDDKAKHLVSTFSKIIKQTFHDLEKRFGAYPHQDKIIMKVSDKKSGNGSFAGALALSSFYVEHMAHELGHHWFLQSVSPLNGSDTWFYEGLGYWIPYLKILGGFEKVTHLKQSINLTRGNFSLWSNEDIFKTTEVQSPHQLGAMVIASINTALKKRIDKSSLSSKEKENYKKNGLDVVLKKIAQQKAHSTFSTLDFKKFLEDDTGIDFSDIFTYYMVH